VNDDPAEPRLAARLAWQARLLLAIGILAASTIVLGYILWTGQMGGGGEGGEIVRFREDPFGFAFMFGLFAAAWLWGLRYTARRVSLWMDRGSVAAIAYRKELERQRRRGSRVGNAIAWIILIPLVLVALLAVVVVIFP
jgi:hypothetical protein